MPKGLARLTMGAALLLHAAAAAVAGPSSPVAPCARPSGLPSDVSSIPAFASDFNHFVSSADGSRGWMTTGGAGWRTLGSNHELECYMDQSSRSDPFRTGRGVLTITASASANSCGLPYTSGIITTEKLFSMEYGFFEMTAKLPAGKGLWPGFWLLPRTLRWPPEIDVVEVLGDQTTTDYVHTHSGAANSSEGTGIKVPDTAAGFHSYGVDWEPNTITWYFDGRRIYSVPTPSDLHQPMYMLAQLGVGGPGSWPGAPSSPSEFPAHMQIRSIRAYPSAASTGLLARTGSPGGCVAATRGTGTSAGHDHNQLHR